MLEFMLQHWPRTGALVLKRPKDAPSDHSKGGKENDSPKFD
jgi:hypothetical protein